MGCSEEARRQERAWGYEARRARMEQSQAENCLVSRTGGLCCGDRSCKKPLLPSYQSQ